MTNKTETLVEKINKIAQSLKEYYRENTDNYVADVCASFSYGDDKPNFELLDDDVQSLVGELKGIVKGKAEFREILSRCSDLECVGMFLQNNEIYSVGIGEIEKQLPDEIVEELRQLTKEEHEYVRRHINAYMREQGDSCHDCIYLNFDYDRWVLILDTDKLETELESLRQSA